VSEASSRRARAFVVPTQNAEFKNSVTFDDFHPHHGRHNAASIKMKFVVEDPTTC